MAAANGSANQKPGTKRAEVDAQMLERQLPYDQRAEIGMLGSMMILPDCIDDVVLIAQAHHCYDESHQTLFRHIVKIHEAQRTIDHVLLKDSLAASGELEVVGGLAYVAKIINAVPHAGNAVYYAGIVKEKWARREAIYAATDMLKDAYADQTPAKDIISRAENQLFDVLDEATGVSGQVQHASETMDNCFAVFDARANGTVINGIKTGFHPFDERTGGFHRGEFVVIAARPSHGKSALAVQFSTVPAIDYQAKVMFCSLEMSAQELSERFLVQRTRINLHRVRNGFLSVEQRHTLMEASGALRHSHYYTVDDAGLSLSRIGAMARRHRRTKGLDLLFVDYLQLVDAEDPRLPRQEQVQQMSRSMKRLARELDITVICLAQLNRQNETQGTPRIPRNSDLRESGGIENDADVILFSHRQAMYLPMSAPENQSNLETATLVISKQRNGMTGDFEVLFQKECTLFLPKADQPDYFPAEAGMNAPAGGSLPLPLSDF